MKKGNDVFLHAHVSLDYIPSENLFLGLLSSSTFGVLSSRWIAALQDVLDPSSPNYNPDLFLYFIYSPTDDFGALTKDFATSGASTAGLFNAMR